MELGRPDWPPGSVIYTGPNEPNLGVVNVLETDNDEDPERFKVQVIEERDYLVHVVPDLAGYRYGYHRAAEILWKSLGHLNGRAS
jgi:hypothetical protein